MVHVVNGDQLQSLLTVIKYLTKDIEDKEETFEVRGPTARRTVVHDFQTDRLARLRPSDCLLDP